MPCTTLLVGKNASYDGSTLVARSEDSPSNEFMPKKFIVVHPDEQPKKYKSILSHCEVNLENETPMKYTAMPNAVDYEGLWSCAGVNELNISMSATETITSNERVLAADPLVNYIPAKGTKGTPDYQEEVIGGLGEEDFVTLVLPYIKSAKDGVIRLGKLLETHGTYEMNGIAFQDEDEIWWLETIGGHHWIAKRVPDDAYVVMPNQLGIEYFDLDDAFGNKKEHLCSADLKEFISKHHLDLSLDGKFNARYAFGSHDDSDHVYNTPRAWIIQKFFNPKTSTWTGENPDYTPHSDDIPWARKPERKITVEDVKYVLSHHYQGTKYDTYGNRTHAPIHETFRPIGINRNNVLVCVQIRPYMPEEIKAIEWIAYGSNVFNAFAPFYVNINKTPEYFANINGRVSTDNSYWANRLIAIMADAHYHKTEGYIEKYQSTVLTASRQILLEYDDKITSVMSSNKAIDIITLCEQANDNISNLVKEQTDKLLDKVLFTASCNMKNTFRLDD